MDRRNLRMVDADGHVVEDDRLIVDFLEEPYRANSMVTRFPLFPTLDGMQRGAIAARLESVTSTNIVHRPGSTFLTRSGLSPQSCIPPPASPLVSFRTPAGPSRWRVGTTSGSPGRITDSAHGSDR